MAAHTRWRQLWQGHMENDAPLDDYMSRPLRRALLLCTNQVPACWTMTSGGSSLDAEAELRFGRGKLEVCKEAPCTPLHQALQPVEHRAESRAGTKQGKHRTPAYRHDTREREMRGLSHARKTTPIQTHARARMRTPYRRYPRVPAQELKDCVHFPRVR